MSVPCLSQDSERGAFYYRVSMKRISVKYERQEERWSIVSGTFFLFVFFFEF